MKKIKIILAIIILLGVGMIWIIEPLSLTSLSQVKKPESKSEIDFNCVDSSLTINSRLEIRANGIIDEQIWSNKFLGVTTGLYIENCGTYVSGAGFSSKKGQVLICWEGSLLLLNQ